LRVGSGGSRDPILPPKNKIRNWETTSSVRATTAGRNGRGKQFDSQVSVLERNSSLLHREDKDVTEGLETLFRDEGINLILSATVDSVSGLSGESVKVTFHQDGMEKIIESSHLLVATGRTPNTENLGLELAGVELTERGYIRVNERLETTAPGIWAIGEVAGSPQFTHVAYDDFRVVRDNLAGGIV